MPILQVLKQREQEQPWKKHEIGAIVVSPTRELALQTKIVLNQLLESITVSISLINLFCTTFGFVFQNLIQILFVGGTSVEEDVKQFRESGGNIIICTPGRLEDLLTRNKHLNLVSSLKTLVRFFLYVFPTRSKMKPL